MPRQRTVRVVFLWTLSLNGMGWGKVYHRGFSPINAGGKTSCAHELCLAPERPRNANRPLRVTSPLWKEAERTSPRDPSGRSPDKFLRSVSRSWNRTSVRTSSRTSLLCKNRQATFRRASNVPSPDPVKVGTVSPNRRGTGHSLARRRDPERRDGSLPRLPRVRQF